MDGHTSATLDCRRSEVSERLRPVVVRVSKRSDGFGEHCRFDDSALSPRVPSVECSGEVIESFDLFGQVIPLGEVSLVSARLRSERIAAAVPVRSLRRSAWDER